ncbi:MAG: GHKL domain-containing protein [Deltaproteobacteria bacterium]|nr:GHKL domain-containing protein [Deltaproteobacteria bacterium]
MNLISNAIEAMAGTSKSKDGWKIRETADGKITVNSNLGKDNIIINIADTGPGISKEDMAHIFDPFYTRKKEMGMGIGLSLCHGIIEDHNGSIAAKNSPEGGTIFTIILPIK